MIGYFIFVFILLLVLFLSELTRKLGFKNLTIKREADKKAVGEGESFKITVIIENNKKLPISFLLLNEKIPVGLQLTQDENILVPEASYHVTRYSIGSRERIKRSYLVNANKRGTYLFREIKLSVGDVFGFYTEDSEIENYIELLVYPTLADIKNVEFNSTSLFGDTIIKRWVYKDPLYVKGIREYSVEDRMKDIHWKSSLKMNKLMVKDYDYTSEMEIVIILDVQCGNPYWSYIDKDVIERGVSLCAAMAKQSIKEGMPVGMWTNSQIIYYSNEFKREITPSLNSLKSILELCARIDYTPQCSLQEFLMKKSKHFSKNVTYILISSFLSEESIAILSSLRRKGFMIKLMDISPKGTLPFINGIEKALYNKYKGEGI